MSEVTPLNVWSKSDEEIGRLMSNFANTSFVLDGVEFASVEAFYMFILTTNEAKRERIRKLYGVRAKHEEPKCYPKTTVYGGETIEIGSAKHVALIKRAIRAKLDAHPEIARAFAATAPRPIVHETGHPDRPGAVFPASLFCGILSELRDEYGSF